MIKSPIIKSLKIKHVILNNICLIIPMFLSILLGCDEKHKIRETCNNYIKGRVSLDRGDSILLQSVTEDSLFKFILLNHQYEKILDAPIIKADLNIQAKSVEIKEDCATCLTNGAEYYRINLCKDGEIWKVTGENGIYVTTEMISKVKTKIADYKKFLREKPSQDSVFAVMNSFFNHVKIYFKTQEIGPLKELCDKASIDFIQRLYKYAKHRTGLEILIEEMDKPYFLTGDFEFDHDKVSFIFYKKETSITLQQHAGSYIVTGFHGISSKDISEQLINKHYVNFLKSLKLLGSEQFRNKIIN